MKFKSEYDMKNGKSGPDEQEIPWDEDHDPETQAMLNMADTCKFLDYETRKSLREERKS